MLIQYSDMGSREGGLADHGQNGASQNQEQNIQNQNQVSQN